MRIVVDCRFTLTDPPAGRAAYEHGHIPGARYAHLDDADVLEAAERVGNAIEGMMA